MHDAGSGSREFRPLIDQRPLGTRLILVDWPGHGCCQQSVAPVTAEADPQVSVRAPVPESGNASAESGFADSRFTVERSAKDLHSLLNLLGLRRPTLAGSGFGAAVALHYAASHPQRIPSLVLCQPAGLIEPRPLRSGRPMRASLLRAAFRSLPGTREGGAFVDSSEDLQGRVARAASRQAQRTAIAAARMHEAGFATGSDAAASLEYSRSHLRAALHLISCPILFALSRGDRRYPLSRYLALLNPLLSPSSPHRLTVFAGGVSPLWDEPVRFGQALAGFVQAQVPFAQHHHAWVLSAIDWPSRDSNLWKCVHPDCDAERILPAGQNANEGWQLVSGSR
jgi:pimeloyl-ACP methyl ester carboxylesterase